MVPYCSGESSQSSSNGKDQNDRQVIVIVIMHIHTLSNAATWGVESYRSDVNPTETLCLSHTQPCRPPRCKGPYSHCISPPCSSRTAVLHGVAPTYDGTTKYIFQISQKDKTSTLRANVHPFHPSFHTSIKEHTALQRNWKFVLSYCTDPFFPQKLKSCRFLDVTTFARMQPTSLQGDEAGPCSAPIRVR